MKHLPSLYRTVPYVLLLGLLPTQGAPASARSRQTGNPPASSAAARKQVAARYAGKLDTTLTLTDGKRYLKRKRRELGIGLDPARMAAHSDPTASGQAPILFRINRALLQKSLRNLAGHFGAPPRNARLVVHGPYLKVLPSANGRTVDAGASAARIAEILEQHPATTVLPLVMKPKAPHTPTSAYRGMTGRLSEFTSHFNVGNAKRAHNLRLAAARVNGRLVPPGQTFSLNQAVGERKQDRGFLTAHVFEDGKVVDGIGGGVSQVVGTLFNAALLSGLPIVEYHSHSRPVSYLPVGRDATVAWDQNDLKIKNNTNAPLYITCTPSGSGLTAALYGAKRPQQRVAVSVQATRLSPTHIKTVLYRTIKAKGQIVKREVVGRADYAWQPNTKTSIPIAKRH